MIRQNGNRRSLGIEEAHCASKRLTSIPSVGFSFGSFEGFSIALFGYIVVMTITECLGEPRTGVEFNV